jgi:phenylalanyl-tRNA synthetase beta subunit
VAGGNEEGVKVMVPPYRVDVQREADVVEEILRIYGYDNVEIPPHLGASSWPTSRPWTAKSSSGTWRACLPPRASSKSSPTR